MGWTPPEAKETFQAVSKLRWNGGPELGKKFLRGCRQFPFRREQKVLGTLVALPPADLMERG
jgi:hypothetical protein